MAIEYFDGGMNCWNFHQFWSLKCPDIDQLSINLDIAGSIWYRRIQEVLQEGIWEQDLQNLQADCLNCDLYIVCRWQSTVRKIKIKICFISFIFYNTCFPLLLSFHITELCLWYLDLEEIKNLTSADPNFSFCNISPLDRCVVVSQKSPMVLGNGEWFFNNFNTNAWMIWSYLILRFCLMLHLTTRVWGKTYVSLYIVCYYVNPVSAGLW